MVSMKEIRMLVVKACYSRIIGNILSVMFEIRIGEETPLDFGFHKPRVSRQALGVFY